MGEAGLCTVAAVREGSKTSLPKLAAGGSEEVDTQTQRKVQLAWQATVNVKQSNDRNLRPQR